MQGLTRNPLADPGLLGVSAGVAFAMAMAVAVLLDQQLDRLRSGSAFLGAVIATVVVYLIGSAGRSGASPVTLALAGCRDRCGARRDHRDPDAPGRARRSCGCASGRRRPGRPRLGRHRPIAPFMVVGLLLARAAARGLNAVALGDDLAPRSAPTSGAPGSCVVVAVTLLCGAATAAVGPIWFLGLMVPHVARWTVGPDQRWILAYIVAARPDPDARLRCPRAGAGPAGRDRRPGWSRPSSAARC